MVATSLPFWLQHSGRTMPRFSAEPLWSAAGERKIPPSTEGDPLFPHQGALVVEALGVEGAAAHEQAWRALMARALEPDVFMEPDFALTAARHFNKARRPTFVLVWGTDLAGPRLIGLCPVRLIRQGLGSMIAAVWTHAQATAALPLLDRDRAGEALGAILAWADRQKRGVSGLLVAGVPLDGPLYAILAERRGARAFIERRTRAILTQADPSLPAVPAPKHPKELLRLRRRLSELGGLHLRSARGVEAVRDATEEFLELEARGWKGDRGTALLSDPALATFTRTMTRLLARRGQCRIDSLELNGRPIAMGIVLSSRDRAYFWKTAYDESVATYSPGAQLAAMLTDVQLHETGVVFTDSCAIPDHPMIDRLWRERRVVADLLLAPSNPPDRSFRAAVRGLVLGRRCRAFAKTRLLAGRRVWNGIQARFGSSGHTGPRS